MHEIQNNAGPAAGRGLFSWGLRSSGKVPSVPSGMRVYAVGDIHGHAALLDELNAGILSDSADWRRSGQRCVVIYLGDYVDRGPDSAGVIERLTNAPEALEPVFLLGNHDKVMLDFLQDASVYRVWKAFGGMETLLSYGVRPPRFNDESAFETARGELEAVMPESHLLFLRGLQHFAAIGGYYFVHAGIRPGIPLQDQRAEDQLWIRGQFLDSAADFGAVVVHGHTPSEEPVEKQNRICVDTGAYMTGRLTAVVLEGTSKRFIQAHGAEGAE